jgi:hypothetical protein
VVTIVGKTWILQRAGRPAHPAERTRR